MATPRRRFLALLAVAPVLGCGRRTEGTPGAEAPTGPAASPSTPEPDPAAATATPTAQPAPEGALADHITALRERFADRGWTVTPEPPFAVVGDGSPAQVEGHAASTVRWAVRQLEAAYFEAPPDAIITIYLFETDESYARNAEALFGEAPDTPYGYYSPTNRALVMNIGTGGGTLVHEIVHPYMAANFRQCPSWFNEGLASLYEQSAEVEGHIVGLTNWRLAGLQQALQAGRVPSFQQLCESGEGFYSADPGTNYAQARYLCYWLQQNGVLASFYRKFRASAATDPTGYTTLSTFVGPDMDAFFTRWSTDTLALRYG